MVAVSFAVACTAVLGDFEVAPGTGDAGSQQQQPGPNGTAGDGGTAVRSCEHAQDCPDVSSPAQCAVAECKDKRCVYAAVDKDGDGHLVAGCSAGGVLLPGDDCADGDPTAYPGGACTKRPDGSDVVFPNGTPLGACKGGTWTCTTGTPICEGVVAPEPTENCALKNDANCDGVPDDGCDCPPNTTGECGNVDGLPLPCKKGTRQCSAAGKWGPCVDNVEPKARDCSTAADNDCSGEADGTEAACLCPGGVAQGASASCTVVGAKGVCADGSHVCQPSADKQSGVFGACTGPAPSARDCGSPKDINCDGVSDELEVGCGTPCTDPLGSGAVVPAAQKFTNKVWGCAARRSWDARGTGCASGWSVCGAAVWTSYTRSSGAKPPSHKYWLQEQLGWGGSPPACWVPATPSTSCGAGTSMTVCPYAAGGAAVTDPANNVCNWSGCSYGNSYVANDYFGGCAGNTTGGTLCCQ